jgi:hypothetical protein
MQEYLQNKYNWNGKIVDSIWWLVHGKALASLSTGKQKIIQKYIHQKFAYNKQENMFHQYISPKCFVCSDKIECEHHIIQCQSCTTRQILRKNYLANLRSLLEHNGISESVIRVMISNLSSWLNNTPYIPLEQLIDQDEEMVIKAASEQMVIGWEQWFYGRNHI